MARGSGSVLDGGACWLIDSRLFLMSSIAELTYVCGIRGLTGVGGDSVGSEEPMGLSV